MLVKAKQTIGKKHKPHFMERKKLAIRNECSIHPGEKQYSSIDTKALTQIKL